MEIAPRSLPELFKQLGDQNNSQQHKTNEIQNFKEIVKLKFKDSRHAQLSIYAVFDEESDVQLKSKEIRPPETKT